MVILPDVQKSVRSNSEVTSLSILSLLVPSLLLLLHWEYMKGLLLADFFFFFRDYNEDSPWGWNHWLKKTVIHAQCWPQGETFEACKVQMDSLALHVLSNSWAFETKYVCLVLFSKRWQYFSFHGKTQVLLDLYFFRALSKKNKKNMNLFWMTTL